MFRTLKYFVLLSNILDMTENHPHIKEYSEKAKKLF